MELPFVRDQRNKIGEHGKMQMGSVDKREAVKQQKQEYRNENNPSEIFSTQYMTSRHLVSNPNKEKRKHVHYISCVCYMQKTDKGGFPISKLICRFGMMQYKIHTIKFTCQISKVVSNS